MKVRIPQNATDAVARGLTAANKKLGRRWSPTHDSSRLRLSIILAFITFCLLLGAFGAQASPVFFPAGQVPSADFRTLGLPPIQKASGHGSSLAFGQWLLGIIWGGRDPSLEATVKLVMVDIDRDGDPDLVAITSLPRLLVWLNDGQGHFSSWHARSLSFLRKGFLDPESNEEDAPLLRLEPRQLAAQLKPVASTQIDRKSSKKSFECCSLRSPRAPPSLLF